MNYNGHEESLTAREFDDSERWKILDYMTAQFQAPFREVREVKKKKAS